MQATSREIEKKKHNKTTKQEVSRACKSKGLFEKFNYLKKIFHFIIVHTKSKS